MQREKLPSFIHLIFEIFIFRDSEREDGECFENVFSVACFSTFRYVYLLFLISFLILMQIIIIPVVIFFKEFNFKIKKSPEDFSFLTKIKNDNLLVLSSLIFRPHISEIMIRMKEVFG